MHQRPRLTIPQSTRWLGYGASLLLLLQIFQGRFSLHITDAVLSFVPGRELLEGLLLCGALMTPVALGLKSPRLSRFLAAALLAGFALFTTSFLLGLNPLPIWTSGTYLFILTTLLAVAALGLTLRLWWSRWLGMGLALAAVLGFGTAMVRAPIASWMWPIAVLLTVGALLILVNLAGAGMSKHFEGQERVHSFWRTEGVLAARVHIALTLAACAFPMLLVFAWERASAATPFLNGAALTLAPVILVGVLLCTWRKSVGLLVLASAGAGLCLLSFSLRVHGDVAAVEAMYYGLFWMPAGVSALWALSASPLRLRNAATVPMSETGPR